MYVLGNGGRLSLKRSFVFQIPVRLLIRPSHSLVYIFSLSLRFIIFRLIYMYNCTSQGPSIYDVHKRSGSLPPPLSTCVHKSRTPSPLWTSTCGRHEIGLHIVSGSWIAWLIDDSTGTILSVPFCPLPFCPRTAIRPHNVVPHMPWLRQWSRTSFIPMAGLGLA